MCVCVCVCGGGGGGGGGGGNSSEHTVIVSASYVSVGSKNHCTMYMSCVERKTAQLSLLGLREDNTMTISRSDTGSLASPSVSLAG